MIRVGGICIEVHKSVSDFHYPKVLYVHSRTRTLPTRPFTRWSIASALHSTSALQLFIVSYALHLYFTTV